MNELLTDNKGVTLISLMIGIAISSIVMAIVYGIYFTQTTTQRNQQMMTDMMQNVRAGLYHIERDVRIAGYDPENDAGAGFTTANLSDLGFTVDLNNDGDTADAGESVRYTLSNDADGDGVADAAGGRLQAQLPSGGGLQDIANDIQALKFYYFDNTGTRLNDDGNGNVVASINNIRTVQIALVARTMGTIRRLNNTKNYAVTLIDGTSDTVYQAPGDAVQRALLTTSVRCRNY